MNDMSDIAADVTAIGRIAAVSIILDIVCRTTGMGFAAVARVTEDRWVACQVNDLIDFGLKAGGELDLKTTICHEIRQHREPVVINHVAEDARYRHHHTPLLYGFQSYLSIPIILKEGTLFGTLCAIDPRPHMIDKPEIIGTCTLFADLIARYLEADRQLQDNRLKLAQEREIAELREQFIAVLGHDLRNPLMAVRAGTAMMLKKPEEAAKIAAHMQQSVNRMAGLVDNLMDFARGRLGSGIALNYAETSSPAATIVHIIEELQSIHPERQIKADLQFNEPIRCDRNRIGQMLSNLLGNALSYGAVDQPVIVSGYSDNGVFKLSVANTGAPIPEHAMDHLFKPFVRGDGEKRQEGLGLGLYIAHEIALAHGGNLTVASTLEQTCFTFEMRCIAD